MGAPHEALVGWFATGSEITSHSALIHDYYARETKDPIHLTLDTTLTSGRVTMKAYVFVPLGVPGATSGSMFTPVQVELNNIEISLGKFRLEIFLVYISSGGQRWGGVGAKLGQSYCPQRMNSLLSGSERANDPAL